MQAKMGRGMVQNETGARRRIGKRKV